MNFKYRKLSERDVFVVEDIVYRTFSKFNSKEGTREGVEWYLGKHSVKHQGEKLAKKYSKFFKEGGFGFVVLHDGKIIGFSRGTKNHLRNLFLLGKYHKRGIGAKLIDLFEREAVRRGSKFIKLNSSLYSRGFYLNRGYKKSTGVRNRKGLNYQPMIKRFAK